MLKFDKNITMDQELISTDLVDKPTTLQSQSNPSQTELDPECQELRVSLAQLCVTTQQLATLLKGGMNLVPALTALIDQLDEHPFAKNITAIRDDVNSGLSFGDALERHPNIFSKLYVSIVRAGQSTGTLDRVLMNLAAMLENRQRLQGKIKSAMVYPAIMACVAISVVMFLMAFVVPSISKIFLDMDQKLPAITIALISISEIIHHYFWLIIASAVGLMVAIKFFLKSSKGRFWWDQHKLVIPFYGDLSLKIEAARLCRSLATLLSSGISILNALAMTKDVVQNKYLAQKIEQVGHWVSDGKSIAQSFKETHLFEPILFHTISVGEMSGNLEDGLGNIAAAYENQVDNKTKTLTTLLEPMIAIAMGLVVGFIVLAILLPIFEINQMI